MLRNGVPAQTGFAGPEDSLRPVGYLQLGEDVGDVVAYGLGADEELPGDFGVRVTLGDEVEDLALAGGEFRKSLPGRGWRRGREKVREAKGDLDLVYPEISIQAEPHVAVVDTNVDRRGTRAAAEAYLKFAYSDEAQEIAAKHFYRPSNAEILKKHAADFPTIKLFPVTEIAKDFPDAHKQFIAEGGVFDGIYKPKK